MKWPIWILSIFLLLAIESGIFGQLNFLPVSPWLGVVLCAVAVILFEEPRDLIIMTIITGVLLDLISSLPDGILLLGLSAAIYATYYLVHLWLAREYHLWLIFLSVGIATLLFGFGVLGLVKLFSLAHLSLRIDYGWIISRKFIWYIVINAAVTYPVYWYVIGTQYLAQKASKIK